MGDLMLITQFSKVRAMSVVALGIAFGASSSAKAQSSEDFARVTEAIKKLEARVTTLESENKQVKKEAAAARAEAQALRSKKSEAQAVQSVKYMAPQPTIAPVAQTHAYAKAPPPAPTWTGLYAGAAFGMGSLHSTVNESTAKNFIESNTHTSLVPPFSTVTSNTSETRNSVSDLGGRNWGAIGNLILGYNYQINQNWIVGGQIEGGVSNIHVNLNGSGNESFTFTRIETPPGGAAGTTTGNGTTSLNSSDAIANQWMISVLGRGGVLIDPMNYAYVLGGYTYGRFKAFNETGFGMNGGTIGGGWERRIAPGWTLRAEYRYTKFQSKDVTSTVTSTTTTANSGPAFTEKGTEIDSSATVNHVSADMHSMWVGVAHYFP